MFRNLHAFWILVWALLVPVCLAKPRVLTTFLPLTSHALAIAGEDAVVTQLIGRGVGAHDYQFKPSDMRRVAESDLIILNGLGLESWLEPMLHKAGKPALLVVDTSKGLDPVASAVRLGDPADSPKHACASCAETGSLAHNPHVWLDPILAIEQARSIADALARMDPDHAEGYRSRFATYAAQLVDLDREMRATLAPHSGATLVTFHDAFPYFARRYDLHYAGALEIFPGREPSPRELAALVAIIREHKVSVIFSEQGYDPALLASLARHTGARVAQLDTLENGEPSATSYIDGMRRNAVALATAFSQSGVAVRD